MTNPALENNCLRQQLLNFPFLLFLQFSVGASLCRIMYVPVCENKAVYLLKVSIFPVLIENLISRGRPASMIYDNNTNLEANPRPIFSINQCNVKARNLQCTYTENRLYSELGDTWWPVGKIYKLNRIQEFLMMQREQVPF